MSAWFVREHALILVSSIYGLLHTHFVLCSNSTWAEMVVRSGREQVLSIFALVSNTPTLREADRSETSAWERWGVSNLSGWLRAATVRGLSCTSGVLWDWRDKETQKLIGVTKMMYLHDRAVVWNKLFLKELNSSRAKQTWSNLVLYIILCQ